MLKGLYSFFLGLLLVVFIGMGVASFYPKSAAPDYPITADVTDEEFAQQRTQAQQDYEKATKSYNDRVDDYDRNVSLIVLVFAIALMTLGLVLYAKINVLADGLLLGGVFSLLYSIGRSFAGGEPRYSFVVIAAGLITTMAVGYFKFVKPQSAKKHAK